MSGPVERPAGGWLFERDGPIWHPQPEGVGPWGPDWLHGGPVAALVASLAEETVPGPELVTTRLTLELVKPVRTRPLEARASVLKAGRRLALIDVELLDAGSVVAYARLQRTRTAQVRLPELAGSGVELRAPADRPEDFAPMSPIGSPVDLAPFVAYASEIRTPDPRGIYDYRPTAAWIRVFAELLPGVPLSPTAAVLAAADYGNALGAPEPPGSSTYFPNADLSVHLARAPTEAWVRLDPTTTWLAEGIGHTRCALADRRGMLGTSAVTLVMGNL